MEVFQVVPNWKYCRKRKKSTKIEIDNVKKFHIFQCIFLIWISWNVTKVTLNAELCRSGHMTNTYIRSFLHHLQTLLTSNFHYLETRKLCPSYFSLEYVDLVIGKTLSHFYLWLDRFLPNDVGKSAVLRATLFHCFFCSSLFFFHSHVSLHSALSNTMLSHYGYTAM